MRRWGGGHRLTASLGAVGLFDWAPLGTSSGRMWRTARRAMRRKTGFQPSSTGR
ncbi:hypothetical protein PF007_g32857 [Phytophthora fragariae]|uniref:Uncharacterized protein n=1 Tax=Phytophthora fragariae TaxID=53985 RepID=A0A6A3PLA6_9STRA|nr:hypothetical protein PF009_g32799 [Phytophthora fragariae]KAE8953974.1 hypothetical protein PF011_g32251 [Phytophthora fragariae]KAE9053749.1 hypothetical protein PF007_g32857 [Phytophthora fragariae]KAE9054201.1 hypothetical protein PF006_g33321 [Phytophthora fragariae]